MFLLINKSTGITSHDVINQLRRITGIKKIGHAGTLDPLARGLLIVAIGRESTKKINQFTKMDKEYIAEIKLGATSDTYDREGKIIRKDKSQPVQLKEVEKTLSTFLGPQLQTLPLYSATKAGGKKLYQLARANKTINSGFTNIEIKKIKILKYKFPDLKILVQCSSGTYIRSLAHDLGQKLGVGGYLENLKRTKIGNFDIEKAISLDKLNSQNWQEHTF